LASWAIHHSKSEELARQAEAAVKGDKETGSIFYERTAKEEELALSCLDQTKKRTIGITVVSTVSLYFKGRNFQKAEQIAYRYLTGNKLPIFAIKQLHSILQKMIELERAKEDNSFRA